MNTCIKPNAITYNNGFGARLPTYFLKPVFNNMLPEEMEEMKQFIQKRPVTKTRFSLTQKQMEVRKTYKRQYEFWSLEEKKRLGECFRKTNDLTFLTQTFRRNASSLLGQFRRMKK